MVFLRDPSEIFIEGKRLTSKVYMLPYHSITYNISSPSLTQVKFAICLFQKTCDSLEFWISPASETYSITKTTGSSKQNYCLLILDSNYFSIKINKHSDPNDVYYSNNGGPPDDYLHYARDLSLIHI